MGKNRESAKEKVTDTCSLRKKGSPLPKHLHAHPPFDCYEKFLMILRDKDVPKVVC